MQAVLKLFLKLFVCGLVIAYKKRATARKGYLQLRAKRLHSGVGADSHLCLQASRPVVVACVYDGGICAGHARADVCLLLDEKRPDVPAAQIPGCKAAKDTAADHNHVILHHLSLTE